MREQILNQCRLGPFKTPQEFLEQKERDAEVDEAAELKFFNPLWPQRSYAHSLYIGIA